jgi:hypothetical protein
MNTSESIDQIAAALVLAQAQMLPLIKDSNNPFFKSKYADLTAVTQACYPALQANGICVMQSAERQGELGINIKTRLIHSSGQFIETDCAIPPAGQDPQKYGSAVTYGRRYGLQAAVGLAAQDDDGEAAMARSAPATASKPALTKPVKPAADPNEQMMDNIIKSFGMMTTLEALDAKMTKAKTTFFGDHPDVLAAYEANKARLAK